LALFVAACAPTATERVRDYNEDGVHLYQHGSYAAARDCFQAALSLQPTDPDLLYNLGQCHDRLGQAGKAERCYRACLERAPDHAECRHALTVTLVRQGRKADAAAMIDDWLGRAPNRAGPYAEDAWLRLQEGDLINARSRLQQALEHDPRDNRALTELAHLYETMDRPDRALALYERALEANPRQPEIVQRVSLLRSQGAGRPRPD
jgi:Tfp pilus assembly protein PilF